MKRAILTVISVLILVFSSVLIYHIVSDESVDIGQSKYEIDPSKEIFDEIDSDILDEYEEIEIGEMI